MQKPVWGIDALAGQRLFVARRVLASFSHACLADSRSMICVKVFQHLCKDMPSTSLVGRSIVVASSFSSDSVNLIQFSWYSGATIV